MTTEEAKNEIEKAGGSWDVFSMWMYGQTCGIDEKGNVDIYEYDVRRFIEYNCNPKNEPLVAWD